MSQPLFARGDRPGIVYGAFAFSDSYPTGGEDISEVFDEFLLDGDPPENFFLVVSGVGGYQFGVDYSDQKLLAYGATTASHNHTQDTHTHDLKVVGGQASGEALQHLASVLGKTAATNATLVGGSNNVQGVVPTNQAATGAGALAQIANATDLHVVLARVPFMAFGVLT
jgi:hypothetical protein